MTDAAELFYAALLEDDADALYARVPCGYLSTRPDGLIVKVNETLLALTGYEHDDLVGRRSFASLLSSDERGFPETHDVPTLHLQGGAREIALELVAANGDRIPVLVDSVVERDADGEATVIRTAVFDATGRRAVRARAGRGQGAGGAVRSAREPHRGPCSTR